MSEIAWKFLVLTAVLGAGLGLVLWTRRGEDDQ